MIYFCFAIRHFSTSSFGQKLVIECFQPFGPPCHQLMYTYYQFAPPMQMSVQGYGKPYKRCGATYGSVEINPILPETRPWIIPAQVSMAPIPFGNLQFVKAVLIIESAVKSR